MALHAYNGSLHTYTLKGSKCPTSTIWSESRINGKTQLRSVCNGASKLAMKHCILTMEHCKFDLPDISSINK